MWENMIILHLEVIYQPWEPYSLVQTIWQKLIALFSPHGSFLRGVTQIKEPFLLLAIPYFVGNATDFHERLFHTIVAQTGMADLWKLELKYNINLVSEFFQRTQSAKARCHRNLLRLESLKPSLIQQDGD